MLWNLVEAAANPKSNNWSRIGTMIHHKQSPESIRYVQRANNGEKDKGIALTTQQPAHILRAPG